jgi:hypothetical protein
MIGINNWHDLEYALLHRRSKIVGVLFCPFQEEGDSLNATWPRNFDDWNLYSGSELDILAPGYSFGPNDEIDKIEVRKLDHETTLLFSRAAMYECVDFVRRKTENKWLFSGEFDLLFLDVGERLGIAWHQFTAIDVGMLLREGIYPNAQRFMHELINTFKAKRPPDVEKVYWDLQTLPTIK